MRRSVILRGSPPVPMHGDGGWAARSLTIEEADADLPADRDSSQRGVAVTGQVKRMWTNHKFQVMVSVRFIA